MAINDLTAESRPKLTKAELGHLIKTERRAALVVNTRSRQGYKLFERARDLLIAGGFAELQAHSVRDPTRLPEVVRDVIAHGCKLVVIGGGDGTISSVVDDFAYKDVALGLLPLGTANSFGRAVGIPLSLEGAIDVIAEGKVADVDLVKINQDYYANMAALGLSPAIGRSVPHLAKRYLGKAGYLVTAIRLFLSYEAFRCRVDRPGMESIEVDALEVLIANGPYHGGMLVARQADVESRDLIVHIVTGTDRWRLFRAWWRVGLGLPELAPLTEVVRGVELHIDANPRQDVSIDGEVITQTPIHALVARQALRLMVPQEFVDTDAGF